jgi:hypothetical protein
MRTYIKKLQSKSEGSRKQILVGSLIVCMAFVGVIWVNSLGYKFSSSNTAAKVQEDIKPFALFGKTISDTVGNVTASVGSIKSPAVGEANPDLPTQTEVKTEKVIDLIPVETQ